MPTFTKRAKPRARTGRSRTFHSRGRTIFPALGTKKIAKEAPEEVITPEAGETATQVDEINRLIKQSSTRLAEVEEKRSRKYEEPVDEVTEDAVSFNGVSSEDEKVDLLQAELAAERRRALQLKHQLEFIETEFQKEKNHLDDQVHELKKEMHRTAPIQDTKFFSLSKELRTAVDAIHSLQDEMEPPLVLEPPIEVPVAAPTPEAAKIVEKTPEPQPEPKKKKLMITGGVAVLLVLITGLSLRVLKGASTAPLQPTPPPETGQVQGVSTDQRYAQSQSDVSYDETVWETIQEPMIGMKVDNPSNAVNIIKTDSSLTFIRKTGYIFKVQKIETGLDLKDYWKQIQSTSLNYTVSDVLFKNKKALFLELHDTTDYPGNRYLVKMNNYIFDVWYALPSSKFGDDDIKRAERMLTSLVFTL